MNPPQPGAAVIERMRWPDIAQVARLDAVCFGPDAWSEEFFWAQMAVPGNRFWVARGGLGARQGASGPEIVGYVGVGVSGPQADILTLGAAPHIRGRGLGGRLLDVTLDAVAQAGVEAVYLEVRAGNDPAVRLYESRGFEVLGTRAGYYAGADAIIMRALLV